MKNIPVFTTEHGVASLILEKIPYTAQAYVTLHDTPDPVAFLRECADFCSAAGAESIYASGNDYLTAYPIHTQIISMTRNLEGLPDTDAVLFPVQANTLQQWREIYNEKMRNVPNAAFLSIRDSEKLLQTGNCYFAYRAQTRLGIGVVSNGRIDAIASVIPGAGRDIVIALCSSLYGETVSLEVARNNSPAVRLYEKLGFLSTGIVSTWYKIK